MFLKKHVSCFCKNVVRVFEKTWLAFLIKAVLTSPAPITDDIDHRVSLTVPDVPPNVKIKTSKSEDRF